MRSYYCNALMITVLTAVILCPILTLAQEAEVLPFGVAVCLTGPCALSGENAVHGAQLAVEDLNSKGGLLGHRLGIEVEDTQDATTGARAVSAYRSLRRKPNLHLLVGPTWAPGQLALAPLVARDAGAIMITHHGGLREFHEYAPNLFNSRGIDETGTRELARFAFRRGARTAVVFGSQQPWELSQSGYLFDEFQKIGGKVLLKLDPPPNMSDFRAEALTVAAKRPDAILFSACAQLPLALQALQPLYHGIRVASFIDDSQVRLAGSAIEGVITVAPLRLSDEFTKRLAQRYPNTEPLWTAHTAYDTIMIYSKAIKAADSFDPREVLPRISQVRMEDGMSGPFAFDGGRVAIRSMQRFQIVRNGKLVPYTEP